MNLHCGKIKIHPGVFAKICRTCLCEGEFKNIFQEKHETKTFSQILSIITIQVQEDDSLPQNICTNCSQELTSIHSFITKCKSSEQLLLDVTRQDCKPKVEIFSDENDVNCDNLSIGNETDDEKSNSKIRSKNSVKKTIYRCKICDLDFECISELRAHKQDGNHSKRRKKSCHLCSKTFAGPYLLKQHMRSHTKEKPYKCDICSTSFSNSSNLSRHKRTHSGERPHICDICGKAFTQSTILNEHKLTHSGAKPYICSYCGKSFRAYANYKTHLTRHKIEAGEIPKEELENFKCKECDRYLSTKGALKMHMLIHGEKMFLCTHCGKGFVNKGGLRSHSRIHSGEKPFKCRYCDKTFGLQGSLKQHELIHTGQRPYSCTMCPKAFVQHHQLQYHLRTHSGERPYICPFCAKSFALNGNLKVHIRTHTGETPYHCTVCNKGFYDSSSMKKHFKGHADLDIK